MNIITKHDNESYGEIGSETPYLDSKGEKLYVGDLVYYTAPIDKGDWHYSLIAKDENLKLKELRFQENPFFILGDGVTDFNEFEILKVNKDENLEKYKEVLEEYEIYLQ